MADFDDSNIAMLNSKLHKDVRLTAAKTEAAWDGAGTKPGIQIWRIEKFQVVDWDENKYGTFCIGDSYIVLHTYKAKDTQKLKFNVHFWLGAETTQDEAGTAAYKTVELDDFLGDVPVQYREVQGCESSQFRRLFPKLHYQAGGVETGFNIITPTDYRARLLHLKGKHSVRITEVKLSAASLSSGDVFVLDNGLQIWQWNGANSSVFERKQANMLIHDLKADRHSKPKSVILDSMEDDESFWTLLGGKPDEIGAASPDDNVQATKKLFKLSDADGSLKCTKVAQGAMIKASLLDPNDVFILDERFQCFVWVGKNASLQERKNAMFTAVQYLNVNMRSVTTPLVRVVQGMDCPAFERALDHSSGSDACGGGKPGQGKAAHAKPEHKVNRLQGVLELQVHEAKDLHTTQRLFKQDPFARVRYDKLSFRTNTHEDGSTVAVWDLVFSTPSFRFGLTHDADIELDVMNENLVRNSRVGSCAIPVATLVAKRTGSRVWFPITRKGNLPAGQVCISWTFTPPISISVVGCSGIPKVQMLGTQDPYVKLKVANQVRFRTATCNNGGQTPSFSDTFKINPSVVSAQAAAHAKGGSAEQNENEYLVEFKVKNDNIVKDGLIAYGSVSLTHVVAQRGKTIECLLQKSIQDKAGAGKITIKIA